MRCFSSTAYGNIANSHSRNRRFMTFKDVFSVKKTTDKSDRTEAPPSRKQNITHCRFEAHRSLYLLVYFRYAFSGPLPTDFHNPHIVL